ncbi:hypothetical protein B0J11DRAFT_539731 [Dendryphion nanum]|uniref:NAD(P)-binding protein n=1 Tax=Dendryphion nanum TaxID=256645 RepID=A0A9P9D987_9PLEO|nr:hypothetical protein B0J11DRAFT_539731 [Dendryphion nanum]
MSLYLLTGAARGIGLEIARQLTSNSSTTVIAIVRTISHELADLEKQRPNLHIIISDLSSLDKIANIGIQLPTILRDRKITHVINNAAIVAGPDSHPLALSAFDFTENMAINVLAPAKVVEAALPFLSSDGIIVNITSGIASLELVTNGTIPPNVTAYSISKAALNMYTVHLAMHLKGKNRVVCLDPGHVKTRLGGNGASVETSDSAKGVIAVVEGLSNDEVGDKETGRARFLNFLGEEVPW